MKEKNLFTNLLGLLGGVFLILSMVTVIRSSELPYLLFLTLIVCYIGLFPIRMPNALHYSLDGIMTGYIMLQFHWTSSLFASAFGLLTIFIRLTPRNNPLAWHRFFISLGMYAICQFAAYQLYHLSGAKATFFSVLLIVACNDILSYVLTKAIKISILGRSALQIPRRIDVLYTLLMIGFTTFITLRLVQAGTFRELVQELIFSAIILFLFTKMSDLNQKHAARLEEKGRMFEEFLDADDRLCLQLDREGAIEFANSAVEHVLGYSREDLRGTSVWGIVATEQSVLEAAWQSALEGSRGAVTLTIRSEDGRTISCKATLLPAVRNKQVTGVLLIGTGSMIDRTEEEL